jgi:hypothetical protein
MSFTSTPSRWSDVGLATAARGISTCGDFLAATALTLALQSAGAGGWLSRAAARRDGAARGAGSLTGRLADRVDSRILLVGAGLAQAAICVGLAYARHPLLIIGLVALLAAGLAVTQPVLSALVPAMVRPADLPRASALNQTAGTLGALAGPALAGLLVGASAPACRCSSTPAAISRWWRHTDPYPSGRVPERGPGGGRRRGGAGLAAARRPAAGRDGRHGGGRDRRGRRDQRDRGLHVRETLQLTTVYGIVTGRDAGVLVGAWSSRGWPGG